MCLLIAAHSSAPLRSTREPLSRSQPIPIASMILDACFVSASLSTSGDPISTLAMRPMILPGRPNQPSSQLSYCICNTRLIKHLFVRSRYSKSLAALGLQGRTRFNSKLCNLSGLKYRAGQGGQGLLSDVRSQVPVFIGSFMGCGQAGQNLLSLVLVRTTPRLSIRDGVVRKTNIFGVCACYKKVISAIDR